MNRKVTFLLIVLFSLIFFIGFIFTKTTRYNRLLVNEDSFENIKSTRKQSDSLKIESLKFDGYELLLDYETNTWYYSLIEESKTAHNPNVSYHSNASNTKIAILDNKITKETIELNQEIKLIIYNKSEYAFYSLRCTTLPLLNITFDSTSEISSNANTEMHLYLFDNRFNATQRTTLSNGTIHVRGVSSIGYPKLGYKISLTTDSLGNNVRNNLVSLLGMRQDDDWILYAGYNDQEKIRNVFGSNLWMQSCATNNMFQITNGFEYKYVELFFNNTYWGLYALGFKPDEKQLNLSKDENGNYNEFLFKKVTWEQSELEFNNYNETLYGYDLLNSSKNDINAWDNLKKFYYTLQTTNSIDDLYQLSDIKNAIDYYLFIILAEGFDNPNDFKLKNVLISLKKYNNQYVVLYTPWDLDMSFGNAWGNTKNFIVEYALKPNENIVFKLNTVYYLQKLDDLQINEKIKNRYAELRNSYWSNDSINQLINDYENNIYNSGAFLRDKAKWPEGNYNNYEEKLNNFKNFVLERLKYMDEKIKYIENINK